MEVQPDFLNSEQVMLRLGLATLSLCLMSLQAQASSYCFVTRTQICDTCASTMYQKVVVSTVPRPEIPGRPADRPWCKVTFRSLGGDMHLQLVKPPAHGEFKTANYAMWFKSATAGPDNYAVDVIWRGPTNEIRKARVDVQVEVMPGPM
jgi:hypothetical protein